MRLLDLREVADVTVDHGGDIAVVPGSPGNVAREGQHLGKAAVGDDLDVRVPRPCGVMPGQHGWLAEGPGEEAGAAACSLRDAQWPQVDEDGPAGEGFGQSGHGQETARSGQDELARPRVVVDGHLDRPYEPVPAPVDLVDEPRRGAFAGEADRIFDGGLGV